MAVLAYDESVGVCATNLLFSIEHCVGGDVHVIVNSLFGYNIL